MKKGVIIAFFAVFLVESAAAQFNTVPLFYDPAPSSIDRWTVAVSPSVGLNDDSGKNFAIPLILSRSISRLTLAAGISTLKPEGASGDRSTRVQVMGNVAVRLLPSPQQERNSSDYSSFTIDIIAGVGYVSLASEVSEINIPVGLGFAYTLDLSGGGISISPWIVPHLAVHRVSNATKSVTQTGGGFSAGVNAGFEGGLGLFLGVDWKSFSEGSSDGVILPASKPLSAGGGIRYRWD